MVAGTKKAYFWVFAFSAWLATSPASLAARAIAEGANVSGQVASHTSVRPFLQGITEIPSGLLPSEHACPWAPGERGSLLRPVTV